METFTVTPMQSTDPVSHPAGLEEQIRCRAYQLYEERAKTDGQELDDWLLAEAEIMTHHVRRKAS